MRAAFDTGHPYFLQLLCHTIFNDLRNQEKDEVTHTDVDMAINEVLEKGYLHFMVIWDSCDPAEKIFLSAMTEIIDQTGIASKYEIQQVLNQNQWKLPEDANLETVIDGLLEKKILVSDRQDTYRFVIELIRLWIIRYNPIKREEELT
jgi:hypothetical protein